MLRLAVTRGRACKQQFALDSQQFGLDPKFTSIPSAFERRADQLERGVELAYPGLGACEGASEWMHLDRWKRCHTRGLPAEERHTTRGTAMGCTRHHRLYDAGFFDIEAVDEDRWADGPLRVLSRNGTTWHEEPEPPQ